MHFWWEKKGNLRQLSPELVADYKVHIMLQYLPIHKWKNPDRLCKRHLRAREGRNSTAFQPASLANRTQVIYRW